MGNAGSILRLVRRLGDADLHRQRFAATSIMRTTQRGCAEIIESRRDPHMRIGAANAIRRVESNPAKLRHARLRPGMTSLLLGNAVTAKKIAADISRGNVEIARRRYEDMGDILAHSALERESFRRGRRSMGGVSIERHFLVQALQHQMQGLERIVSGCVATGGRKIGDIRIRARQCRIAQVKARREPLDGAAQDALSVPRLDFAQQSVETSMRQCATYWLSLFRGVSRSSWLMLVVGAS